MKPPEGMSLERVEPTQADLAANRAPFRASVDVEPFRRAIQDSVNQALENMAHFLKGIRPVLVHLGYLPPDRHHPIPLPIDGHAYRRRRRARARRSRR